MELLPVVCLCLLTRCGVTSADGSEPAVITVKEDEDALLPCSRSTENIEHFDWNKVPQNDEKQKEVFRYVGGRHSNSKNPYGSQDDGFKGRVFHFPEELKHGNASIIIRKTKMADNGNYTCTLTEPLKTFRIQLVVGTCPKPNLKILASTEDGLLLQCKVQGAFPKPKVELKDSSGKILDAEPQVTDRGDRYDIILQTTVTKMDNYSCVSTQEEICHQIFDDTHVPVNEDGGSRAHSSDPTGWIGILAGILGTALFFVIFCAGFLAVLVYKGCITLHCNKTSQTGQMEASGVLLNQPRQSA